jgi:hypothetical protein
MSEPFHRFIVTTTIDALRRFESQSEVEGEGASRRGWSDPFDRHARASWLCLLGRVRHPNHSLSLSLHFIYAYLITFCKCACVLAFGRRQPHPFRSGLASPHVMNFVIRSVSLGLGIGRGFSPFPSPYRLREKKAEMARIIDIYNQAQQRRADAQADMVEMKLAADSEQRKFEGEWKRLAYLVQQRRATPGPARGAVHESGSASGRGRVLLILISVCCWCPPVQYCLHLT